MERVVMHRKGSQRNSHINRLLLKPLFQEHVLHRAEHNQAKDYYGL